LKLRTRSTPAEITTEGNQTVVTGAIGSSVFYAAFQEFGTKTLPERAPFRTGIRENLQYISDTIEKEITASLKP
jgi:phage gpG-like protein